MLSTYLILCCPVLLPLIFPSMRVFSKELALCIRWPKYWSFRFSISPSNEHSELISSQSKGVSRVFFSTTIQKHLWLSAFFMVQLSHSYMATGKDIALTICNFVGKMMYLLLNTLSRFVIAFLGLEPMQLSSLGFKPSWFLGLLFKVGPTLYNQPHPLPVLSNT